MDFVDKLICKYAACPGCAAPPAMLANPQPAPPPAMTVKQKPPIGAAEPAKPPTIPKLAAFGDREVSRDFRHIGAAVGARTMEKVASQSHHEFGEVVSFRNVDDFAEFGARLGKTASEKNAGWFSNLFGPKQNKRVIDITDTAQVRHQQSMQENAMREMFNEGGGKVDYLKDMGKDKGQYKIPTYEQQTKPITQLSDDVKKKLEAKRLEEAKKLEEERARYREAQAKSQPKPEAKPEAKVEAKPEVKPEPKVEAKVEAKPEVKVEANPAGKATGAVTESAAKEGGNATKGAKGGLKSLYEYAMKHKLGAGLAGAAALGTLGLGAYHLGKSSDRDRYMDRGRMPMYPPAYGRPSYYDAPGYY